MPSTIVISAGQNPSLNGSVLSDPLRWGVANPGTQRGYVLDITAVLADLDTELVNVDVSVSPSGPGELTAVSVQAAGGVITVVLTGGVRGRNYAVKIDAEPSDGDTLEYEVGLLISPTLATFPLPAPADVGFGPVVTWTLVTTPVPALFFTDPRNAGVPCFGGQPTGEVITIEQPPGVIVPSLNFTDPRNAAVLVFRGQPVGLFFPIEPESPDVPWLDLTIASNAGVLAFGGQPTGEVIPL